MSKEIFVPVDGIAHKVTKVYAPVNGVARSVKKVYKGINGIARQVFEALPPVDALFANNTWADIILACQLNAVPDTWVIGDQMPMMIGGVEYLVDIIGKNHDDYADGSGKAPLTFQLHECYNTVYSMNHADSNVGGWEKCKMRNTYLPEIFAVMPPEVQVCIREVTKRTSAGTDTSKVTNTADKLFLLSEIEVTGKRSKAESSDEGTQYAYYANGGSLLKTLNGLGHEWWLRSPASASDSFYCLVGKTNNINYDWALIKQYGVAPAFCF